MKILKTLTGKVKNFVRGNGGVLFVWVYASVFISCGLLTIFGIVFEFATKGSINYQAVNNFIREYFAPSIFGTFAILGVLLIDKNRDGIPDKWEEESEKDEK